MKPAPVVLYQCIAISKRKHLKCYLLHAEQFQNDDSIIMICRTETTNVAVTIHKKQNYFKHSDNSKLHISYVIWNKYRHYVDIADKNAQVLHTTWRDICNLLLQKHRVRKLFRQFRDIHKV